MRLKVRQVVAAFRKGARRARDLEIMGCGEARAEEPEMLIFKWSILASRPRLGSVWNRRETEVAACFLNIS